MNLDSNIKLNSNIESNIHTDKTIYGLRFAQLLLNNEDEHGNTETCTNIVYERLYEDGIDNEAINEAHIIYKSINYIDSYCFYYYAKCNSNFENKSNNNDYNAYYMEWLPIEKEKLVEIFMKNLKLH